MNISYKVKYKRKAEKFIKSNREIGIKYLLAFDDISKNFNNIKKYYIKRLAQDKNIKNNCTYRLRISKYRAIFEVLEEIKVIDVQDINSRG